MYSKGFLGLRLQLQIFWVNFEIFVSEFLHLVTDRFIRRVTETDFFSYTFMKRALEFDCISGQEIRQSFE